MRKPYTFDDISLVPQFNNVPSRTEPLLETWLTKKRKMGIPLLAANMDSVIGEELADILIQKGSVPIFHRFMDFETQCQWVKKYQENTFISCGIHKLDETRKLLDLGAAGVCIDVAHGHSDRMFRFIGELKKSHPGKDVIAGNVCTTMAYHDLVNAGADAVKVGIGPGAICTTRMLTGFGVPQFSAIYDCAQIAEGASSVMSGKLFAFTKESAAQKRASESSPTRLEAKYRGQASVDFQNEYYGGLKGKTVAEGVDFWGPVAGSVEEVLADLLGGLRSGLTYGGARNIKELQRKAEFIEVSCHYLVESGPRSHP